MNNVSLFIFFYLMSFSFSSFSQKKLFEAEKYSSTDTLNYQLLSPEQLKKGKKYPIVLFLHGSGERGSDNQKQLKHIEALFTDSANRINFPCYVLAPQCRQGLRWAGLRNNDSIVSPLVLTEELIDELIKKLPIDKSRVYITGLSMGGAGTWESIFYNPEKYAAAVPICGWGIPGKASEIAKMPIWVFHGELDNIVKIEGSRNMVESLRNFGSSVLFTEYKDVNHESWVPAYQERELMPWLFSQKLKK